MKHLEAAETQYFGLQNDNCLRHSRLLNSQAGPVIYGVSSAKFGDMSYNYLGKTPGGIEKVLKNRLHFLATLGIKLADLVAMQPVHKTKFEVVDQGHRGMGAYDFTSAIPATDGLITTQPNVALSLNAADCSPIIYLSKNRQKQVLALVHAGREGTISEISQIMVQRLGRDFDVDPEQLLVYIGPTITHYPHDYFEASDLEFWKDHLYVPANEADLPNVRFHEEQIGPTEAPKYRISATLNGQKTPLYPDLTTANIAQLVAAGVPESQIEASHYDTYSNALEGRIFSHVVSTRVKNGKFPIARFMATAQLV